MSGGPDGDVAGNQICNLHRFYPHTAKLLALTDRSGTIFDSNGLNLEILKQLFKEGKSIRFYPPKELSEGGFLLDKNTKRSKSTLIQQTLCWKKNNGSIEEEWLSGSEMNSLYRNNVHHTVADIFIPAGGRPRTLNEANYKDFLDDLGFPTAKAIIEGANLYLTPAARRSLEELGVLIVKDSSANKGGVICSSFEVLCGLTLSDKEFLEHKEQLVKEILRRIEQCCFNEANLLLKTHLAENIYLTEISDQISERINQYAYQLLEYLDPLNLSQDPNDPLIKCFLDYCLPTLRNNFSEALISEIPEHHKKAIIACHIAAEVVYKKGLNWSPTIVDILPLIWQENKFSK
jgi:glutamate dehydrogenase